MLGPGLRKGPPLLRWTDLSRGSGPVVVSYFTDSFYMRDAFELGFGFMPAGLSFDFNFLHGLPIARMASTIAILTLSIWSAMD